MMSDESTTPRPCSAERRGDDTHWWKAYQAHSSVGATPSPGAPPQPAIDATEGNCKAAGMASPSPSPSPTSTPHGTI